MPPVAAIAVAVFAGASAVAAAATALGFTITLFGVSLATIATIGLAVSALVAAVTMMSAFKKPASQESGQLLSIKLDPHAAVPVVYGRTATAGYGVYKKTGGGSKNPYLYAATILSIGPITDIESARFDDLTLTFASSPKTGMAAVTGTIPSDAQSKTFKGGKLYHHWNLGPKSNTSIGARTGMAGPLMTANTRFDGLAHTYSRFEYNTDAFPGGEPRKQVYVIKGRRVWDPRADSTYPGGSGSQRRDDETTWVYSQNPYLAALDWVLGYTAVVDGKTRLVYGIGAPRSTVDVAAFVAAANIADENQWTVGGQVTSDDDKYACLRAILQAGGGVPVTSAGRISVLVSSPKASVFSITDEDIIGNVETTPTTSFREGKNTIIGQYQEENTNWETVPTDEVSVPEYVSADDGEILSTEVVFGMVQNARQAKQLATYELVNLREALTVKLLGRPRLLNVRVGEAITLTHGTQHTARKMVVMARDFDPSNLTIALTLRAESETRHAFALGQTQVAPPVPALNGFDPSAPEAPGANAWAIEATQITNAAGVSLPAMVINGANDDPNTAAIKIEFRVQGGTWVEYSIASNASTRFEITGLTDGTAYEAAISYRTVRGYWTPRRVLGPVNAGTTISGGVRPGGIAWNPTSPTSPITGVPNVLTTIDGYGRLPANSITVGNSTLTASINNLLVGQENTNALVASAMAQGNGTFTAIDNYIAQASVARDTAVQSAANAQTQSNAAVLSATNALANAVLASTRAGYALANATSAQTSAGIAGSNATTASTQASYASANAVLAQSNATLSAGFAGQAQSNATLAATRATYAQTNATISATQAGFATANASIAQTQAGLSTTYAGQAQANAGLAATQLSYAQANAAGAQTSANLSASFATAAGQSADTANYLDVYAVYGFANTIDGWTVGQATLTPASDGVVLSATAADPTFVRSVSFPGSRFNRIVVDITRLSARTSGAWDGTLYFTTAGHGYSGSYRKLITNDPVLNVRTTLIWDMANLSFGGTNWLDNTITAIRLDLDGGSGGSFKIHSVRIVGPDSAIPAEASQAAVSNATIATTQATYAAANAALADASRVQAVGFAGAADTARGWAVANAAISQTQSTYSGANAALSQASAGQSATYAGQSQSNATLSNTSRAYSAANAALADTARGQAVGYATAADTARGWSVANASIAATQASYASANASAAQTSAGLSATFQGYAVANAAMTQTQAGYATANAAAAASAAGIQATIGVASLNKNSTFAKGWVSGQIPPDWVDWANGYASTAVTGQVSPNAIRFVVAAGQDKGIRSPGYVQNPTHPGFYVLEASVTLVSGSLVGSGLLCQFADAGGNSIGPDARLNFATDADNGVVGAGVVGRTYRFSKVIQITNASISQTVFYAMAGWSGLATVAAKTIDFHTAVMRPATAIEIAYRTAFPDGGSSLSATVTELKAADANLLLNKAEASRVATLEAKASSLANSLPNLVRNGDFREGFTRWERDGAGSASDAGAYYHPDFGSIGWIRGAVGYMATEFVPCNAGGRLSFSLEGTNGGGDGNACLQWFPGYGQAGHVAIPSNFGVRAISEGILVPAGVTSFRVVIGKGTAAQVHATRVKVNTGMVATPWTDEASVYDSSARLRTVESVTTNGTFASASSVNTLTARIDKTGGNLLTNTDFQSGSGGWSPGGQVVTPLVINPAGDPWHPVGENVIGFNVVGSAGYSDIVSNNVSVEGGKFYNLSAYLATHRANANMYVGWYTGDGANLGFNEGPGEFVPAGGGKALTDFTRRWTGPVQAPSGSAYAVMIIRKMATNSGGDSWMWMCRPMFTECSQFDVSPPPYSVGNSRQLTAQITEAKAVAVDAQGKANATVSLRLDVNGYVSGTRQVNNGVESDFTVTTDKFRIVAPNGGARTEYSDGIWYSYTADNSVRRMYGRPFGGELLTDWTGPNSTPYGSETKANAYVFVSMTAPRFGGSDTPTVPGAAGFTIGGSASPLQGAVNALTVSISASATGTNGNVSYRWSQIGGDNCTIASPNSSFTNVTTSVSGGSYATFQCIISDDNYTKTKYQRVIFRSNA